MRKMLLICAAFCAGVLFGIFICGLWGDYKKTKSGDLLQGTGLRLAGRVGTVLVYTNTNDGKEIAVLDGNKALVTTLQVDGNYDTTHYENGMEVLVTTRRTDGDVITQMYSVRDVTGKDVYTYYDQDGDGLWEIMIDHYQNKKYAREGNAWIERNRAMK